MSTQCPSCQTPIDKHEAGRSTDRCVAEARGRGYVNFDGKKLIGLEHGSPYNSSGRWKGRTTVPTYSSSFAACEVLIEEMVGAGHGVIMEVYGWTEGARASTKIEQANGDFIWPQFAPTLPHAIALAYLSWRNSNG